MKKKLFLALSAIAAVSAARADITVNFPEGTAGTYNVESVLVSELMKPRNDRGVKDVQIVAPGVDKNVVKTLQDGASQVYIFTSEREVIPVYTEPGENLVVNITNMEPLEYSVSGSQLMEEITKLEKHGTDIKRKYFAIARSSEPDEKEMERLAESYDIYFADYVKGNPNSPAVVYALLQLDGQPYIDMMGTLNENARKSTLYPLAVDKKLRVEKSIEAERRLEALQSGNVDAPAFTLNNLKGEKVSLADFRGKWVILDFWGSWCPWCIKGFPALKDAYAKYSGKLEIIGIDCRDSMEKWKMAVERYALPWVQVYNPEPEGNLLLEAYAVQGFPTKVIVSPEGKIANITVGEDPTFFTRLEELLGK